MTAPNDLGPVVQSVTIAVLVIAWIAVGLRYYVRIFMVKSFGIDDWFITLTLASTYSPGTCQLLISIGQFHGRGDYYIFWCTLWNRKTITGVNGRFINRKHWKSNDGILLHPVIKQYSLLTKGIVLVDIGSHVYCYYVSAKILHLPLPPADRLEELASIRTLHHHGRYSRLLPLLWVLLTLWMSPCAKFLDFNTGSLPSRASHDQCNHWT